MSEAISQNNSDFAQQGDTPSSFPEALLNFVREIKDTKPSNWMPGL